MRRIFSGLFTLSLLLLALCAGGAYFAKQRFDAPGPASEPVEVLLPRGSGLKRIADTLADAGAISDALIFRLGTRFEGAERDLKAGEYALPARASMREILRMLREGEVLRRRLTFAEGLTSHEIVALLREEPLLSGEIGEVPAEGSLAPDTYLFERGEARQAILGRMRAAQTGILDRLWETRASDLPFDSKEEALVLASIVERETGVAGERAHVAGVFVNRLRRGMRLQSDPTVIYGVTGGTRPLGRGIRQSELRDDNPFNTYVIAGLPPAPIANPGRDAIAAVLNPRATKDLYFVADGTGGHAFAETLAEHNRNVRKWREIERARRAAE